MIFDPALYIAVWIPLYAAVGAYVALCDPLAKAADVACWTASYGLAGLVVSTAPLL